MVKISILSKNQEFAEDLKQQVERVMDACEINTEYPDSSCNLVLIDEDQGILNKVVNQYSDLPVVFFSATSEISENTDLIIKKPFKLSTFLDSLKNNTLLPKVRRKECLNFKDYSLYPVKKEILSLKNGKKVKLTEKEIDILKYLYQNSPEISSKEELLKNVWGYSSEATTHTVETHIYRLRQKVEQESDSRLIITENNGYRLNI